MKEEIKIVDNKRTKVFYIKELNCYRKKLYPKWSNLIKYKLKLRKYPGENFLYIKKELEKIGIKSADYLEVSKYEILMKEVSGVSVEKAIESFNENKKKEIAKRYIEILKKLLENKIYAPDATLDNFIIANNEITAIDFDEYKKAKLFFVKRKKMYKKTIKFLSLKSDYKKFGIDLVKMYEESFK